jgi:hypothetical protein
VSEIQVFRFSMFSLFSLFSRGTDQEGQQRSPCFLRRSSLFAQDIVEANGWVPGFLREHPPFLLCPHQPHTQFQHLRFDE